MQDSKKDKEEVALKKDDKKQEDNKVVKKDGKKDPKKDKEAPESEEDIKLREDLELLVTRVQESDVGVQKLALGQLASEIKTSTSSMTSVPKPLKFLRPHYDTLKGSYEKLSGENQKLLADILSVLAMTMSVPGSRECLKYRLLGSSEPFSTWGHEYIRFLSGEIAQEYDQRAKDEKTDIDDLIKLAEEIVPFDMTHNAEHEACDLLLEIEKLDKIVQYVDDNNFSRVCLYLLQCSYYLSEPDDSIAIKVTLDIYLKMKQWPDALRLAMKSNNLSQIKEIYEAADSVTKKQLSFMLSQQRVFIEDNGENADIINNTKLSEYFLALGQDLDIMEAKTPEDIYKSNDSEKRTFAANIDSARQNLASTFVNAFVNSGFGSDKLMTDEGNKWLYKNKEHGMISAVASLGMILQWDIDNGLSQIDKYLYSTEEFVKAGALLAIGVVNSGVKNESDPALALLSEHLTSTNNTMKLSAILGLGLAYAGSGREDLRELLIPIIEDSSMEVASIAGLSLGFIFSGSADVEITQAICLNLMERDEAALNQTYSRYMCLGLGLIYLTKQETADATIETLKTVSHVIGKYASLTVETCAYAGTGNVLKIQKLLDICGDHLDEKDKSTHQGIAALGIALISMGEEIGAEMAMRSFDHLLQYGEPTVRRVVPLALGLLSISNPKIPVMDTLSKLSHDHDEEVSMGAVFGLGLIGAGTNNARVAQMLRGLAQYYYKEPNHLFMVRLAQGLVFMGKGTMSLAPYHSDRILLSQVALSGILAVLHSCLDIKNIILGKSHYMLFCIATAIHPRLLMTFDEKLKPLPVPVRVGQAVDTVGQAGRPKTITGFQTHTTPVLLSYGDRAELATEDYLPMTTVLEGFVILRPNPDAPKKEEESKIISSMKS